MMWDVEAGLTAIDKFRWMTDPMVKAGALFSYGLVCTGIKSNMDYAFSMLGDQLVSNVISEARTRHVTPSRPTDSLTDND